MAKRLAYYVDQAEAAAGGRLDDRTDPIELVNDAGRYMVSMAEWTFLNRPAAAGNFVANQAYVALPADFGDLLAVEVPNALQTTVEISTLAAIEYLRGSPLNDPFRYVVAIEYPTQTSDEASSADPRLAIWPTPGTSATNALRILYRAGWTAIEVEDKVPNIPLDVEPLLVQIVRAFGRAVSRNMVLDDLLAKIRAGDIFRSLVASYGKVQPTMGFITGGAAQVGRHNSLSPYRPHRSITR